MSTDSTRSEKVVEDYKKRKIAVSAYHKIQQLIQGFEDDRDSDRRVAIIGMIALLVLLGVGYLIF